MFFLLSIAYWVDKLILKKRELKLKTKAVNLIQLPGPIEKNKNETKINKTKNANDSNCSTFVGANRENKLFSSQIIFTFKTLAWSSSN